jgi:hypothetical protein
LTWTSILIEIFGDVFGDVAGAVGFGELGVFEALFPVAGEPAIGELVGAVDEGVGVECSRFMLFGYQEEA